MPTNGKIQNVTNACMLVNGNQRKLSNSYLRYQRRYSKHGYENCKNNKGGIWNDLEMGGDVMIDKVISRVVVVSE